MQTKLRKELSGLKRLIVKVGSNVITNHDGQLDESKIKELVEDISWCHSKGIDVILVSSGAINAGKYLIPNPSKEIDYLQAASSIGQPILIQKYSKYFKTYNRIIAQILLTHEDFKNRNRFLNAKNTILKLLENNITPILNENDTVSFSEITVGDNDHLGAMTAQMLGADLFVLITSADGLYTKDPREEDAIRINNIHFNQNYCVDTKTISPSGRGGMKSKLDAINKVTPLGIHAIICGKDFPNALRRGLSTDSGTFFFGNTEITTKKRKAWLLTTAKPGCYIEIDEGAYHAIVKNSSLLPSGIKVVHGNFTRGDCVELIYKGNAFALGLVEYNATEINKIKGIHSSAIIKELSYSISNVVIHKDNLLVKRRKIQ